MKAQFFNTCVICKRLFPAPSRHTKTCPACKAERRAPTPERATWDELEREMNEPRDAA